MEEGEQEAYRKEELLQRLPKFVTFEYRSVEKTKPGGEYYGLGYLLGPKEDPKSGVVVVADTIEEFMDDARHLIRYYFTVVRQHKNQLLTPYRSHIQYQFSSIDRKNFHKWRSSLL